MESSFLQISELKKFKKVLQLIKDNATVDEIMEEIYKLDLTEKEVSILELIIISLGHKNGNSEIVINNLVNAKVDRRR